MFFSKTVLISVLGLSALSLGAPVEKGVTAEAAQKAPCTWYDNITGRDCDDDDAPPPRSSPRPNSGGWQSWGFPKSSNNNNNKPSQPYRNQPSWDQQSSYQPSQNQPYVAPASSNPRPANGFLPRPVGTPRPITAPKNDGSDKEGQSSWCDRPDPARRPASCGNGGTLVGTTPRSSTNEPTEDGAEARPEARPEAKPAGPAWQQAAPSKGWGSRESSRGGSRGQQDQD